MVESGKGLEELREIHYASLDSIDSVAQELIEFAGDMKVWSFLGEMGSGKTTMIKAICKLLGVQDTVSSPTFSIVNEYQCGLHGKIFHFDFYRINSENEALDIGFEEYLYSQQLCLIEWPSRVSSLLPTKILKILIEVIDQNTRKISLCKLDS